MKRAHESSDPPRRTRLPPRVVSAATGRANAVRRLSVVDLTASSPVAASQPGPVASAASAAGGAFPAIVPFEIVDSSEDEDGVFYAVRGEDDDDDDRLFHDDRYPRIHSTDDDEDSMREDDERFHSNHEEEEEEEDADDVVFLGARRVRPANDSDDDDDDDVLFQGFQRQPQSLEDADAEFARRLQEQEYAAIQSSNVQHNIHQLYGIMNQGDDSEDDDYRPHYRPAPPVDGQMEDYRLQHRLHELELLEEAEQAAEAAAAARRGGRRGRGRGGGRGRGRAGGNPMALFGMNGVGAGFRGGRGGLMSGLIPELYGAGVAYNPANYVDDDNFDASYEALTSLGDRIGTAKPTGTNKRVTDSLPTKKFKSASSSGGSSSSSSAPGPPESSGDDVKCAICLMEFEDGEQINGLPCLHWFHGVCIKKWLASSKVCPM
ncbi:hypothetical protein HDU98_011277 [Podochytrium sp. JEL0797]|nr:hypothetical protein HDU98_011277 [Podochytrium sp. JEL0797]